jgi:hypothetical protein
MMADSQTADSQTAARRATPNEPDDTPPTADRQAELERQYEANVRAGRPPYEAVEIRTRGELTWIMDTRAWSGALTHLAGGRPDLRRARLSPANLVGVNLYGADLSGADLHWVRLDQAGLGEADLSHTNLESAYLTSAHLWKANLTEADLYKAQMTGVDLRAADLRDTNLRLVKLLGAELIGTDLRGAALVGVRFDAETLLIDPVLDKRVWLGDIAWNGVPLSQVSWRNVPRLGDEAAISEARHPRERRKPSWFHPRRRMASARERRRQIAAAYTTAGRAYRGLSIALRAQGLQDSASSYRLREQRLVRRARLREGKPLAWFGSLMLDWVAGYGERPARAFRAYVAVVLAFAAVYFSLTNFSWVWFTSQSAHLAWYEALVLSLSSFHGRGFFPQMISLGDPVAVVAALEAIMGLFIELIFIATFTQRFFAR